MYYTVYLHKTKTKQNTIKYTNNTQTIIGLLGSTHSISVVLIIATVVVAAV